MVLLITQSSDQEGWIDDLHIYNPSTNTWTNNVTTTGPSPTPRDKHSAVVIGTSLRISFLNH